jgi:hypothetical protein
MADIAKAITSIEDYLMAGVSYPFFLIVGDDNYSTVKDLLSEKLNNRFIKTSKCCGSDDKRPNIDALFADIKTAKDHSAVIGLGEYLAMCGKDTARNRLSELRDLSLEQSRVIILLRGVHEIVRSFQANDHRFDNRRVYFVGNGNCEIAVTIVPRNFELFGPNGIQSLLDSLENGQTDNLIVKSVLKFDESLITVKEVSDAYDGIGLYISQFSIPRSCGSNDQWMGLLSELSESDNGLNDVFDKYTFGEKPESLFTDYAFGDDFKNWIYFIALKLKADNIDNGYLRHVLNETENFSDFAHNIVYCILKVLPTEPSFNRFYSERKTLIKDLPDAELSDFVLENRKVPENSIYYLTDCTLTEKQAIIETFAAKSSKSAFERLVRAYPALNDYLRSFAFNCGELSELLTQYFNDYKRQKLTNSISSDFEKRVLKLAQPTSRIYNKLPTREEILDDIDKRNSFLYWLDALGVEFLGFIQAKCKALGLSISVKVGRAQLPTITSFNKAFYDDWNGDKWPEKSLDEVKHKESGGYNYQQTKLPVHLAKELSIIEDMLNFAKGKLGSRMVERVVIASDHGASRLAVIREKELKYETDTKGEHSGRCCTYFEAVDLPTATAENGYLILADYGRFKGSRAANVEVHGGATLEEVVVPVIELTLRNSGIHIKLLTETVTASFQKCAEIVLFSKNNLKPVSVMVKGCRYVAEKTDDNHHKVMLLDIKRAGAYTADVFDGDDLIYQVEFTIENESGKKNDAFDDLF